MNSPVPELPVSDVEKAQRYYRDNFGFDINWLDPSQEIGAVSQGNTAIFFRKRQPPFEPVALWVHCSDVDNSYAELRQMGANIIDDIGEKPWGLRQFTVRDLDGNLFYFHGG